MAAYHETHEAPHCPTCDCGAPARDDMSTKPENLDASGERVYGIDISLVADMLELGMSAALLALYDEEAVQGQIDALRAAANRDAAGVHTGRASEAGDCVWTVDGDGTWETACGEAWQFTCDGPEENNFRFCHGCGKPVAIAAAPAPGGE